MKYGMGSSELNLSGRSLPLMYRETIAVVIMMTQEEDRRVIIRWWMHTLTTQFHILITY